MRLFLLSLAMMWIGAALSADAPPSPVSLHPDFYQIIRVDVEDTGLEPSGNNSFVVDATLIDAVDGLEPEWSDVRYTVYLNPTRTPLWMDGINGVMRTAAQTFCTDLFGADQIAEVVSATPSSVADSFTAKGVCVQGPM